MSNRNQNPIKILDLDNADSWSAPYASLLNSPEMAEVVLSVDTVEDGLGLLSQLEVASEHVSDKRVMTLRQRCSETLFEHFTHVIACHGCRITHRADYQTKGVLQSEPEQLVQCLLKCAPEMADSIREAARDLGTRYFDWNRGTVGFLFSQRGAIHEQTHYARGSELIQGIINRVGPELARKYVATGRPSLIRCRIPLEWIRDYSLTGPIHEFYAIEPLRITIRDAVCPDAHGEHRVWSRGGFRLGKSIPPDLIEDIIDMSEIVQDAKWVQHVEPLMRESSDGSK